MTPKVQVAAASARRIQIKNLAPELDARLVLEVTSAGRFPEPKADSQPEERIRLDGHTGGPNPSLRANGEHAYA